MPRSTTHKPVGAFAGAGLGYAMAQSQVTDDRFLETLAATIVGWHAAKLPDIPDIIAPPLHPGHRSFGHGLLSAGSLLSWILTRLSKWQDALRSRSQHAAARAQLSTSKWQKLGHNLIALLFRLLAGALAGLVAGYASHLILDAFTPGSLPFVA